MRDEKLNPISVKTRMRDGRFGFSAESLQQLGYRQQTRRFGRPFGGTQYFSTYLFIYAYLLSLRGNMNRREFLRSGTMWGTLIAIGGFSLASACQAQTSVAAQTKDLPFEKMIKTDAEWKRILTPAQYNVTRQAGTEAPYSSPLNDIHEKGVFACVCCELPLFSSETKFDSQTGWPSFYAPVKKINVQEKVDQSFAETRTEVLCNRCDAHLGHVFDDGPEPTGLRYCMNGVALKFAKAA
jgi:peptide-methionine (R)-S-oxide reductase